MAEQKDIISFDSAKNKCQYCHAASFCISKDLVDNDLAAFNTLIKRPKPLHKGEQLFQAGDKFDLIYIVHSGSVKSYIESSDGEQQITGFNFSGDLLGIAGLEENHYSYGVEALETSSFCEIPFTLFEKSAHENPELQQQFLCAMSREMTREQKLILLLGKMDSKRRVASFIVAMSARMQAQGYSADNIILTMNRHDIANYLGMAIETVSRLLTQFQSEEILQVAGRHITIINQHRLHAISDNFIESDYHTGETA
jgi:CRP/FNR family transcriptional regulator